jgi:hypothetical protein
VFGLLFFASIIALIIGLINPHLIIRWGSEDKRTRKRIMLVGPIIIIILFICTLIFTPTMTAEQKSASQQKRQQETKQEELITDENKKQESDNKSSSICPNVGIGDDVNIFSEKFGNPKEGAFKQYKNGTILVIDDGKRAINITIQNLQYSASPNLKSIEDFLPKDKKIIKEYEDESQGYLRFITLGESESLKEAVPKSEGKFVVITKPSKNENKNTIIISIGERP